MAEILENSRNEEEEVKRNKKNKWSKYKLVSLFIVVFILIAGISVCIKLNVHKNSVPSVTFNDDEVMRVNGQKVGMNEFLLYAADVYQGYNLQKEANWDKMVTGSDNSTITFEEQVKGTICEQIRMTKILCMKAKDDSILLSDDESKILLDNAQTYYKDLTSASVIDKALTVDLIAKFYEENALAQKVYNRIVEGYKEEQDTSAKDTQGSELSGKELYFIEAYHDLGDKYDKNYDYDTSINWDLLKQISFADLSKNSDSKSGTADTTTK